MITLIALSRLTAMEANQTTKKKRNNNETINSLQKNTDSTASARTSVDRTRSTRCCPCKHCDRLESDCVECNCRYCGAAAASVGAELRDGAGCGL